MFHSLPQWAKSVKRWHMWKNMGKQTLFTVEVDKTDFNRHQDSYSYY